MPDDGDAPRLVARLVSLDPNVDDQDNVQGWVENASNTLFPNDPTDSHAATTTFGAIAFGTPVQNGADYPILVSGTCIVTAATAALISLGVGPTATPTVDPITPAITVAAATSVAFSAVVPSGYTISLTHTGTITVGSPVCIASPLTGGPS